MDSVEAAKLYEDESIDFIFIDADHKYNPVVNEIKAFLPKMKRGSTMTGHDYTPAMDDDNRVYDAVNDTLGKENISFVNNVWRYEKK